jgi:subtilisin
MIRRRFLSLHATIAVAAVGLIVVVFSGAPGSIAAQATPRIPQDLRARVQRDGRARVIVELKLPAPLVPEGALGDAVAVARQRQQIAGRRARLLTRLPAGSRRAARQYDTVPYVVLDVTPAALDALERLTDDVAGITSDAIHRTSLAESVPLVEADQAWASGYDATGTTIAVLDTGVDRTHPFLAGRVVEEACYSTGAPGLSQSFCPNGLDQQIGTGAAAPCSLPSCEHGTHVAGIAAGGDADPSHRFPGVAKGADVMAVQVFTAVIDAASCGGTAPCVGAFTSDLIAALERVYAVALAGDRRVAAVNMSLGADIFEQPCDSEPYKPIIDNLRAIGVATIVAAGNDGWPFGLASPACISSAISVGATDQQDQVAWFSNTAPFLSLFAPGDAIVSSVPNGAYEALSGTSMAAPHVAGIWAVMKHAVPDASVATILNALRTTGRLVTDTRYSALFGDGVTVPRVRVLQALATMVPISSPAPAIVTLSPISMRRGLGGTLTVDGTGFNVLSVVEWNGAPRATELVDSTTLRVSILALDVVSEGMADVTVFNPPPGGGRSAPFAIAVEPPPSLAIGAPIVPPGDLATVTLTRGFGGSTDWLAMAAAGAPDGVYHQWTYVGAGVTDRAWTVVMPATAGAYEFRLFAGSVRAATSPVMVVDPSYNRAPTLTSISPATAIAGGVAFTLTVSGTNFTASSVARWNGVAQPTTFVNATLVRASVAADDVSAAGIAQVTVFTPQPGGGMSAALVFTTVPRPTLTVNTATAPAGAAVTVSLTGGLGGTSDWLALASTTAPDATYTKWVYVGAGMGTRTWTASLPQMPGTYEFRLFAGGGYTRIATSPPIAIASPLLTINQTSVATGANVTVTLTNGFGGSGDWLAFASTSAANSVYLQYVYVGSGVPTRTWTVATPGIGGTYEFRLFVNGAYTRVATSPAITVVPATPPPGTLPTLAVSQATATSGASVTVTLAGGAGGSADWLAFAGTSAADNAYVQYVYVGSGVTTRTWTVAAPAVGGTYEFRLFHNAGYTRLATSPAVTVVPATPPPGTVPALTVSQTTASGGAAVTVTLSGGAGGSTDWLAFTDVGAPDTSYLQLLYVGAGVFTRTWTVTTPAAGGTFEFRLFPNNGYTRSATSPRIVVSPAAPATLTPGSTTVAPGSSVTVTLTNGPGGVRDWLSFTLSSAPNSSYPQWTYVGAGVTARAWTVTAPVMPGTYEFRLFLSDTYIRDATSVAITVR